MNSMGRHSMIYQRNERKDTLSNCGLQEANDT